jgi:hypothetical protein
MPGDVGDARLLNYFLENTFKFIEGVKSSFWHLPFFFPFQYVIGFSENLFGSAPTYIFARVFGASTETAFQIWFLFGYIANYCAGYYALRRLNGSVIASTVGAVIFAFALPTTAHAMHAHLHYRFGLPLAIVFFADFLNYKLWRYLLIAGAWLVWQFYASIYMGFFTLMLLVTMSMTFLGYVLFGGLHCLKSVFKGFLQSGRAATKTHQVIFLSCLVLLLILLLLLFYPYLQVTNLYGSKRTWSEIATMLPRPQSYFLSDSSFWWSSKNAEIFSNIPMRHEHQMFIGLFPFVLAVVGFIAGSREKNGPNFILMSGMLIVAILITLNISGASLWYFFHQLPLASAIRAMSRFDQAFLFPIAYLSVIAIDKFIQRYLWGAKALFVLFFPLLIAEALMTSMPTSSKESWRQRSSELKAIVPENLSVNSILFFAQRKGLPSSDELDAMWVSLHYGKKTMNGYSGLFPPDYDLKFGIDCQEIPKRVLSYLKFSGHSDNIAAYRELMSRIVPIGFHNCDVDWLKNPPSITNAGRIYSPEEFKALSLSAGSIIKRGDQMHIRFTISNSSSTAFAATSSLNKPIRISWRYIDAKGQPLSGWDNRKNLLFDIPAHGNLQAYIPLDSSKIRVAKAVQISLVQESVFWAHDIGMDTLLIHF